MAQQFLWDIETDHDRKRPHFDCGFGDKSSEMPRWRTNFTRPFIKRSELDLVSTHTAYSARAARPTDQKQPGVRVTKTQPSLPPRVVPVVATVKQPEEIDLAVSFSDLTRDDQFFYLLFSAMLQAFDNIDAFVELCGDTQERAIAMSVVFLVSIICWHLSSRNWYQQYAAIRDVRSLDNMRVDYIAGTLPARVDELAFRSRQRLDNQFQKERKLRLAEATPDDRRAISVQFRSVMEEAGHWEFYSKINCLMGDLRLLDPDELEKILQKQALNYCAPRGDEGTPGYRAGRDPRPLFEAIDRFVGSHVTRSLSR
jgi:hypothetical protein